MGSKRTILIVDDHPLFREGLKSLIARNPRYRVVGEAGCGRDGLRMAKVLKPDLILMDISLPDTSGVELTRSVKSHLPDTSVMIISMHSKIDYITEAFQAGAMGYVVKESATDKLLQGLDAVARGDYFLDSSLSLSVVQRLVEFPEKEARIRDGRYSALTPREQQVTRMLAEGLSTKEIASELSISPKTVESHRANIMEKLNLRSTIELIRYAAKLGLIDLDLWKE